MVNVTNDGWFEGWVESYQHMKIARMCACDKILEQAPVKQRVTITADIKPISGLHPYARIGDKPVILFVLLLLCLTMERNYLRTRRQ